MSRVETKICGVSNADAVKAALDGGAAYLGFVSFEKSPRHLSVQGMADIARIVPPSTKKVGVIVNADDALLDAIVAAGRLDVLQLHGQESPARAAEIARRTGLEVWKAISVKTAADLIAGAAFAGAAHRLIYDAKTPDGAALPGGMGMRFDWTLLTHHRAQLPWGLSGGLDPENVAEAIRMTGAPLVDVSSGVESAPGVKDIAKIADFCQTVGNA